jgi:hypothetical protein
MRIGRLSLTWEPRARDAAPACGRRRRLLALAACLPIIVGATPLAIGGPAAAASGPTPFVFCAEQSGGLVKVFFGYTDSDAVPSFIADGGNNFVTPGSPFQGQPQDFNPGAYPRVFFGTYDPGLFVSISWFLNGQIATGRATSPPCRNGVTVAASALTTTSATLNGAVDGGGDTTTYFFKYGPTTSYGQTTPPQTTSDPQVIAAQAPIGSLSPATTYHYQLVTTTATYGTTDGADQTFTTAALPPPTPAAPTAATVASVAPRFAG